MDCDDIVFDPARRGLVPLGRCKLPKGHSPPCLTQEQIDELGQHHPPLVGEDYDLTNLGRTKALGGNVSGKQRPTQEETDLFGDGFKPARDII